VNQIKSKNTLINWELVAVNPNDKNWNWKDLFYFWANNIQSLIAFSLIASLYLVYELNVFVVLTGSLIASIFVYFFANLMVTISKIRTPFQQSKYSIGIKGAKYLLY